MEVRQNPPQAVMFRLPCGEGDKAQNRSNGVVQINLHLPSSRTEIGYSPQTSDRRFFGTSSYGMGCEAVNLPHSGKEYSRLFKEIMGALT
jgi:hypothetical protein